jgi:simple sugar transport system substrate-binding protein
VVFNGGIDTYQQYGALMFFGSDESLAGQSVGQRLAQETPGGKALCVVHEQGNLSLETRCAGVKQGLANTENLQVNGQDLPSVQQTIQAKLGPGHLDHRHRHPRRRDRRRRRPGPGRRRHLRQDRHLRPQPRRSSRRSRTRRSSSPSTSSPTCRATEAVDSLWLQLTNGNDIGGGKPTLTGPSFVDATNIDKIAGFAANNTR